MFTRIIASFGSIKVIGILIGIITLIGSVYLYGSRQYHKGFNEAKTNYLVEINKLNEQINTVELDMLNQISKEKEKNAIQQEQANHIINTANAHVRRLQSTIEKYKQSESNPTKDNNTFTTYSINSTYSQCWVVLQEAIQRYSEVAKDADFLTERLRQAKSWGKVIQSGLTNDKVQTK